MARATSRCGLLALLALLMCSAAPTPASAGDWFAVSDDVLGWGTAACGAEGDAARCFGLRCNGENPPPGAEWFLFVDDAGLANVPLQVSLAVEGRIDATFSMSPVTLGGYLQHVAPVDLPGHSDFLDALQGGHRLRVTAGEVPPFSLSLAGSRAEITRALAACAPSGRSDSQAAPSCDAEYRARMREAERLETVPNGRLAAEGMRLDAEVRLNLCRAGVRP
jgi:hypothetical protein